MTTTGKVALITGITGQDGSYLAELLLGKGYTVRRRSLVVFLVRSSVLCCRVDVIRYATTPSISAATKVRS
jgi:GDPmannose 4,6-dehydratase